MSDEQRVLARAMMLMQTKGYGWSKALDRAADSMKRNETPPGAAEEDEDAVTICRELGGCSLIRQYPCGCDIHREARLSYGPDRA